MGLDKIAALLRQAEGTNNEHEAEAFMQAAQRLATTYSVDLAVARAHTAAKERRTAPEQRSFHIGSSGRRGLRTYVQLFLRIAEANDVTCDIAQNSTQVFAYGFAENIDAVEALYMSLAEQMIRASNTFIRSGAYRDDVRTVWDDRKYEWVTRPVHGTTARISFQDAYTTRVGLRLRTARDEAIAAAKATETAAQAQDASTGTDLVLLGKQVEVQDYYRAHAGSWRVAR